MEESGLNNSVAAFLAAIHGSLGDGERYRLEIERKGEALDLTVIPLLAGKADEVPEKAKAVRAALALPLTFRGMSVGELAASFASRINGYGDVRRTAQTSYEELIQSIRDAEAEAKNASRPKGKTKKAESKTEVVNDETCCASDADSTASPRDEKPAPTGKGILGF